MDNQILLWLNSFAGISPILDWLGVAFAVYGIYVLCIWALLLSWQKRYLKNIYLALASSIISRLVVVQIIKILVNRPRPFEILPTHLLLNDTGSGQAFSSGHAVIMFAIAFSFYKTKYFWPMIALAAVSSLARVFVGVHYPTDILASIVIAALIVWILKRLFKKLFVV